MKGTSFLAYAMGFFAIFMAVHASIAGDGTSAAIMWMVGIGAVSFGMTLNRWDRHRSSIRRIEVDTEQIRGSYERPDDVPIVDDGLIDSEILYPLWQKCNRCGVYLWRHGVEDHPWEEWRELEVVSFPTDWSPGPGYIIETSNPHFNTVLGCTCPECTRQRNGL